MRMFFCYPFILARCILKFGESDEFRKVANNCVTKQICCCRQTFSHRMWESKHDDCAVPGTITNPMVMLSTPAFMVRSMPSIPAVAFVCGNNVCDDAEWTPARDPMDSQNEPTKVIFLTNTYSHLTSK